jgi:hypothetical protein
MRKIATASGMLILRTVISCLLLLVSALSWSQEKNITGIVRNADDRSVLPGASIQIKGTNKVTITDSKGAYSIQARNNQVIVVSVVGFKSI